MKKTFETLYARAYNNTIKEWKISVKEHLDNTASIIVEHKSNVLLKTCKSTVRETKITKGKNIGKSNETTPIEQAYKEAEAQWTNKKVREEYQDSIYNAKYFRSKRPMLAQDYRKLRKKLDWQKGFLCQPKLNGIRCTVVRKNGNLIYTSREGVDYTPVISQCQELHKELEDFIKDDLQYDGELYVPGWKLNRIGAAVKKYSSDSDKLQFHIFDYCDEVEDNLHRSVKLESKFHKTNYNKVKLVETKIIFSEDDMMKLHDTYVDLGYEGIIIRYKDAAYVHFYRVPFLLKFKNFEDGEFEIVDTYSEIQNVNGEEKELICFWCITKKGDRFKVQPIGTHEKRAKEWLIKDEFIGKQLTVKYQETSGNKGGAKNVPVFGKGVCIRDYE